MMKDSSITSVVRDSLFVVRDEEPTTNNQQPATSLVCNQQPTTNNQQLRSCPRRGQERRGVLLLVVLSLLVLFAMITVTFVLVASQYRRMSRAAGKVELVGNDPRKLLDEAFGQIVRGTRNPQSSLYGHDLLNDLYGNDSVRFASAAALPVNSVAGGQFIDFAIDAAVAPPQGLATAPPLVTAQMHTPGFYNGCVLTVLNGAAANRSTRIVGWGHDGGAPGTYTIRVMAFDDVPTADVVSQPPTALLINGRPFNGVGFGYNLGEPFVDINTNGVFDGTDTFTDLDGDGTYDPADPATDPTLLGALDGTGRFHALLPNPRFFPRLTTDANHNLNYPVFGGLGGADEDYDAPDLQNLALAYLPIRDGTVPNPQDILPSFHRPDLVSYMNTAYGGLTPELARKIMLRPLGRTAGVPTWDHPRFTGSNPNPGGFFNPINGPWDVDNDGDGTAESVWIDIGLPVATAPDGRRYKPLVAILCTDLDGRLNVNAHGNYAQSLAGYSLPVQATGTSPNIAEYMYQGFGTAAAVSLPRGSGYGPAEVNLGALFAALPDPAYENFFGGVPGPGGVIYEGRYGEYRTAAFPFPAAGRSARYELPNPLWGGADVTLSQLKRFDIPSVPFVPQPYNYYTSGIPTNYGSPVDLAGRAMMSIDYAGQPIWSFQRMSPNPSDVLGFADDVDGYDPYALNLSRRRARSSAVAPTPDDNTFTAAELERILRQYDLDATELPDRLRYLLDPTGAGALDFARLVTTDSFDLPTPPVLPSREMRQLLNSQVALLGLNELPTVRGLSIVDLLRARMIAELSTVNQTAVRNINAQIATMLPPEVIAGQRFDLNRPFGNGLDDDGDLVVDEADEYTSGFKYEASPLLDAVLNGGTPVPFDLNNDGTINTTATLANSDLYAKQQYARYLYVMMMLFVDTQYRWNQDSAVGADVDKQHELTARRIAQWAINAVDFRDPDPFMTPFEYDVLPFNDRPIDGLLGSADDGALDRRLVWGCEAPELLLTETLAFHDRRVEDTPVNNKRDHTPMVDADVDYDQVRIPQGSLFLELYCPHNANRTVAGGYSPALYAYITTNPQLELGRMAPFGGGLQYPVWRIAITRSSASNAANNVSVRVFDNPDVTNFDPVPPSGTMPGLVHGSVFDSANTSGQLVLERYIWFSDVPPGNNHPNRDKIFFNTGGNFPFLSPGQYAVVGPREMTYVGLTTGGQLPAQRIELNPVAGQAAGQVGFFNTANNGQLNANALPIICSFAHPPQGWPLQIGANISEPMPVYDYSGGLPGTLVANTYYPQPNFLNLVTSQTDTYSPAKNRPRDSVLGVTNAPLSADAALLSTGLKPNYKTALLQRLANPMHAYHQVTNPYITVDWQPIDLTVFNGQAKQNPSTIPPAWDPDDQAFQTLPANFLTPGPGSRERGTVTVGPNLWSIQPQQVQTVNAPKAGTAVFPYNFDSSLGYLNDSIGRSWGANAPPGTDPPFTIPPNYAYENAPDPTQMSRPFPWLTWNNRPYVSNMELMLVPPHSAEELLRKFSTGDPNDPYDAGGSPVGFPRPFRHMLNFFLTNDGTPSAGSGTGAPHFYRVLDYLHVPSRFVGTETILPPAQFSTGSPLPNNPLSNASEADLASFYHPPFNRVSNYREPGRVNINTIAGLAGSVNSPTWLAILNGGPGATWQKLLASRRGDFATNPNVTTPSVGEPYVDINVNGFYDAGDTYTDENKNNAYDAPRSSVFASPFRSAGGGAFRVPGTLTLTVMEPEVDVTLLRPETAGDDVPLFRPGFTAATDPTLHAYFRYQPFTRLSNLLTTRSNVYAVWITVGYFEVTPVPAPIDYNIYPDGYWLGQELGSDTGEITRHRAFYIFDRSIPVGFEPGKDHNIDDAVLVKRFIE